MEGNIERDCSALGGLFQQIITDMKNGTPLWEDLVTKATKLHTCLRVAIQAISAYLDAFQKIADAATNARGATKEIGTALTRICLRHKAVEARMKTFTSAIMDCLVVPLQEKLEDWKKAVVNLDKEHAKDYKRARAELKKRSTDTLRLQKKAARKSVTGSLKSNPTPDLQRRVECSLQDVTERRHLLEETEKRAVRAALVEERSRFCLFVGFLKPVVDEEVAMLSELTHLQDAVEALEKHTTDPFSVPPASEQVIIDTRGQNHSSDGTWTFRHTPPSSPSSLGSRKSSMCSISSLNSSSSGSSKSHRSLSQVSNISECSEHTVNSALPNSTATWPNLQETMQFERAASAIVNDRPHTISSAYEKGHQRPGLTVYTFQAPEQSHSQPASPTSGQTLQSNTMTSKSTTQINCKQQPIYARPPLPTRCSSLERPNVPAKSIAQGVRVLPPTGLLEHKLFTKPSSLPAHITKDVPQPTYVNMHDLANLAANKAQELLPPPPPEFSSTATMNSTTTTVADNNKTSTPGAAVPATQEGEKDGSTSESSLESSSGYGSQTTFPVDDNGVSGEDYSYNKYCTLPRHTTEVITTTMTMPRRRPLSMSALYSSSTIRNTLLRRGSIQGIRPPPPVRRTSSISSTARLSPVGSLENLPPPPAFLLEGSAAGSPPAVTNASTPVRPGINVAETVKALTELKHTPASPNATRRNSQIQQHQQQQLQSPVVANQPIPAQNVPQFSSFQPQQPIKVHHNSIYAQPNQVIRINPNSSPNAIRRITSTRSQSADRQPVVSGVGSSFIAALSAKLAPSLSPRNSRRHSEDQIQFSNTNISTAHHLKSSVGATQGFLDTLNAKLAQNHGLTQQKAFKIRQLINSRAQPDPTVCHESLMDQIKRGATLRKAARVNDRSAPKIR